jgi:hypothetical protein
MTGPDRMIALLFAPAPGTRTGPVTGVLRGLRSRVERTKYAFVEVTEDRDDWCTAWTIVDDVPAPKSAETLAAEADAWARRALRRTRNALLADKIDSINPMRWEALSAGEKAEVEAYRQALLDWPATETDLLNPTPPPVPSFLG